MGGILDQVEQQIYDIRMWARWIAIALGLLVLINLVMATFVIWGMVRIAKLSEMNRFPRNPAIPDQAVLYGGPQIRP